MTWHVKHKKKLTLGDRAADVIRDKMGSWGFVFASLGLLGGWIIVVLAFGLPIDNPQLTILNLILSCLAALQGAILLIAAKRADQIASELAQHDYDVNIAAKKEIEELMLRLDRLESEKLDKILAYLMVK